MENNNMEENFGGTAEVHPADVVNAPTADVGYPPQQQNDVLPPSQRQQQQQQHDGYGGGDIHYDQTGVGGGGGDPNGGYGDVGVGVDDTQNVHQQQYYDEGYMDDTNVPSVLLLNHFCAHAFPPQDDSEEAKASADHSWEPVRDWMRTHSADEVQAAAEQRDDAGKTALHFACQNSPPKDVIDVFLSIAADIVQWPDSFGWLPIHYACAYGADTQVIKSLAEAFPESKTTVDRKGRTPLHFALGTSNSNSPAVVVLLSSTGAAGYPDDNGMLVSCLFCLIFLPRVF